MVVGAGYGEPEGASDGAEGPPTLAESPVDVQPHGVANRTGDDDDMLHQLLGAHRKFSDAAAQL
jgi:hypothetical protein